MTTPPFTPHPRNFFATTRWSLVLRSQGDSEPARLALAELCEAYWNPVHEFIRRRHLPHLHSHDPRDLTQDFFARLLAGHGIRGANPNRGRFRSFLLGAVRHFLSDTADRAHAAKRGGGATHVPLETDDPESDAPMATGAENPATEAEQAFDRDWAVQLVNRALAALAETEAAEGRGAAHALLKAWLLGDAAALTQAQAAERLGWTENAVRVAIHRLRRRFRDLVRREIAQTIDNEADLQQELRYLLDVLVR